MLLNFRCSPPSIPSTYLDWRHPIAGKSATARKLADFGEALVNWLDLGLVFIQTDLPKPHDRMCPFGDGS
jgi:hypothetical protein